MNEQPPQRPPLQQTGDPHQQGGQPSGGQSQTQYPPGTQGGGGKPEPDPCPPPKPTPTPTPTPTPCPDPCDQDPPYGPPKISADCCPDRGCCPKDADSPGSGSQGSGSQSSTAQGSSSQSSGSQDSGSKDGGSKKAACTWDEVDDPCIRATAAEGIKWSIFTCKCESSSKDKDCTCEQWECGGYPEGVCVPCKPCEGLIPTGGQDPGDGGCDDPTGTGCDSGELQRQLAALRKCISSRQGDKAKLDAEIKARQDREKELSTLAGAFDDIVKGYGDNRQKLICREDCLKGFYRDTRKLFGDTQRYPKACLDDLQKAINDELCSAEKIKCCQKNLEGKLKRVSLLQRAKDDADKALKKADDALKAIKDLNKWIGDQFSGLEALRDQILQALSDKDPQRYKWAFYLFYWKFVPQLCRRFPVPLCCGTTEAPLNLGCKPGDWHPSHITGDVLKALICCAWRNLQDKKQDLQKASDALDDVTRNLDYIKTQVPDDKALDTRIKARLDQVVCAAAAAATSR
jgi:hypothetical protein